MQAHLWAGAAVYNAGHYHAAHDAWEERWLSLPDGDRKDALQGLIQFTAAVYHVTQDNPEGAAGLAESATDYVDGAGDSFEGVALGPVREGLAAVAADPEDPGESFPPPITFEGIEPSLADLGFEATVIAAPVLAEALGYDEAVFEQAAEYAREDVDERGRSPFVSLLFDFVREPESRGIAAQRLGEHVGRREQRESDVDGLF
ncbi:DUF309 domain-containing protein [Halapricum sp. CBA1109]|uniref:DUF309 domain-containing protein n=1 Tax=Halapricum sp. CBA1109 TaxID=2668068 RepID=UPI0012F82778|nr:DUF309 domain-containing protein [Halapricum sp. CBA1109]MUV89880.1 DUF309 domain-containing protein [Halapricum sp. CBA1109]